MLVLTRRTGEAIVIGGNVRITVTAVGGDRVRLGITAPGCIRVDRAEVHERRGVPGPTIPPTAEPGTPGMPALDR